MEKLLEFDNYSFCIITNGSRKKILQNINYNIFKNQLVGIFGASGSGKTTLLKSILGLFEDIPQHEQKGRIHYHRPGKALDIVSMSHQELLDFRKSQVAYIPQQSAMVLNPSRKIAEEIKLSAAISKKNLSQTEIEEVLASVGFDEPKLIGSKYPHQLSGGQLQRVLIASAVVRQCPLILVDEPTSNLDAKLKVDMLDLLRRIQKQSQSTLMLVTHEVELTQAYCDQLVHLDNGLLGANVTRKEISQMYKNPSQNFNVASSYKLFEGNQLSLYYKKNKWFGDEKQFVFRDLSLEIFKGEVLGLIGPSGCGKTSLAKIICGLVSPSKGSIYYKGKDVSLLNYSERLSYQHEVQIIFQDAFSSLTPHLNAEFLLNEAAQIFGLKPNRKYLEDYLHGFGLAPDILDRQPDQMSGGQRQRLLIARALLSKPEILICDEILSSQDYETQEQILKLLFEMKEEYKFSLVFISHDRARVASLSDRIIEMALEI